MGYIGDSLFLTDRSMSAEIFEPSPELGSSLSGEKVNVTA